MRIRPITEIEISSFAKIGLSGEQNDDFRDLLMDLLKSSQLRPEWFFVAEDEGNFVGWIVYWIFPSLPGEIKVRGLHLPWKSNYLEVGRKLIAQSLAKMHARGAVGVEFRLDSETTPYFVEQKMLLEDLGIPLIQEKLSFHKEGGLTQEFSGQLCYKTLMEVGEETFIKAIQQVTEGTLDREDLLTLENLGSVDAAVEYFNILKDIDYRPDWWELAYHSDGNLVGLVVPQKFDERLGAINYIGVVPEYRGKRYVRELLARGSTTLHTRGIQQIIADIDSQNQPLAIALDQAGYKMSSTLLVYKMIL